MPDSTSDNIHVLIEKTGFFIVSESGCTKDSIHGDEEKSRMTLTVERMGEDKAKAETFESTNAKSAYNVQAGHVTYSGFLLYVFLLAGSFPNNRVSETSACLKIRRVKFTEADEKKKLSRNGSGFNTLSFYRIRPQKRTLDEVNKNNCAIKPFEEKVLQNCFKYRFNCAAS